MSFDSSGVPLSGGVLLAAAAFVCTSLVLGQEMARREIDLSGWETRCPMELVANARADLAAKHQPRSSVPVRRCSTEVSKLPFLPREIIILGQTVCNELNDPDLNGSARALENETRERIDTLNAQRIARIQAKAGSQCGCAKAQHLQDSLIHNAVHAGTVRFVSLPKVANREQELRNTLHTPVCAALAEDTP